MHRIAYLLLFAFLLAPLGCEKPPTPSGPELEKAQKKAEKEVEESEKQYQKQQKNKK